jgi:hypothetical protein
VKAVTIYLDGKEARTIKRLFGEMVFENYLQILEDKNLAEDAQNLGALIFDTLYREGF